MHNLTHLSEEELTQKTKARLDAKNWVYDIALVQACVRTSGLAAQDIARRDLDFLITEILRLIGKPAHYTEITNKLNAMGWRHPITERSLHTRLVSQHALFVYLERGVYGLAEWGLEDLRVVENWRNGLLGDVIEVFLKEREAPAKTAEIIAYVLAHKRCRENAIRVTLAHDVRFYSSSYGKYGLKNWITSSGQRQQ